MDSLFQSPPGNKSESNQWDFDTNQMANLQEASGNFMEGLRVRQNSRRSKSFCENAVEENAQMPDDLITVERRPITGINGHCQRPAAMIVASQVEHAFPRPSMRATSTSWPPMQATPRTPMQATPRTPMQATPASRLPMGATSTLRPPMQATPRSRFQTLHIDEKPRNVPVQNVRPISVPSLMQMSFHGPNIAFSAGFRQPQNWYPGPPLSTAGTFQNQNGAPRFSAPVDLCSYCRSSGEQYPYGHTKKSCPKLASMSPCHRCGAVGAANHTDMYCPANKTMLKLKRSEEEHQQFMSDIKKGRNNSCY